MTVGVGPVEANTVGDCIDVVVDGRSSTFIWGVLFLILSTLIPCDDRPGVVARVGVVLVDPAVNVCRAKLRWTYS